MFCVGPCLNVILLSSHQEISLMPQSNYLEETLKFGTTAKVKVVFPELRMAQILHQPLFFTFLLIATKFLMLWFDPVGCK